MGKKARTPKSSNAIILNRQRKIIPGGADKSYGIQVARLAGLPREILDRAKEILAHLESPNEPARKTSAGKKRDRRGLPPRSEKPQLDLL